MILCNKYDSYLEQIVARWILMKPNPLFHKYLLYVKHISVNIERNNQFC